MQESGYRMRWPAVVSIAAVLVAGMALFGCGGNPSGGDDLAGGPDERFRKYAAGIGAHHLCSGTFVVGRVTERSPETVLAEDIEPFVGFAWQDDFEWEVDLEAKSATVWAADVAPAHREIPR